MCIGVERGIGSHELRVGRMCGNEVDRMYNIYMYTSKVLIADGYQDVTLQRTFEAFVRRGTSCDG